MHKVSLLVPFRSDGHHRHKLWRWLEEYWENELPEAELLVGRDWDDDNVFSKTCAVNEAFSRSTGDIIVILDADAYLPGWVIKHCAHRLRNARRHGARTWFVPYQFMYRLTPEATHELLESDPEEPEHFPHPPEPEDVQNQDGSGPELAHHYGALIQIMPREAFETVGGMDEDFRGWGGEDVSFLRALDTLWGKHKNTPNDVFHLYHPKKVAASNNPYIRVWDKQHPRGRANDWLATKYANATGKPVAMRKLVDGQS